jgi:uncharacterized damage-inducible protein DinB
MPGTRKREPVDLGRAVVEAFATNERINQLLIGELDKGAWRAEPPGGKGRTIAAIVAHLHNVRHMWLTVSAKASPAPPKLDRHDVTPAQAAKALRQSAAAMGRLFENAVAAGGHVKDFRPDVVGFLSYAIAHEAHHRGQIALVARQLGHPLSQETGYAMWDWGKRWKECGFER